ncbi:MAG: hypothetical protein ACNS64_00150 [Candidatus Halalkalibacterium sp. M3_1C_030]
MTNDKKAPAGFYFLIILILFQGLSGIWGGTMLVLDPSGSLLQLPLQLLSDSPFQDYLIPGLILLILLGILPLVIVYALWKKVSWSVSGAFLIGIMLVVWIGVQILIVGYQDNPPLQALYGSVGILILITLNASSVMQYLRS